MAAIEAQGPAVILTPQNAASWIDNRNQVGQQGLFRTIFARSAGYIAVANRVGGQYPYSKLLENAHLLWPGHLNVTGPQQVAHIQDAGELYIVDNVIIIRNHGEDLLVGKPPKGEADPERNVTFQMLQSIMNGIQYGGADILLELPTP